MWLGKIPLWILPPFLSDGYPRRLIFILCRLISEMPDPTAKDLLT